MADEDQPTILIEPWRNPRSLVDPQPIMTSDAIDGYVASYPGIDDPTSGETMADALEPMLETVYRMLWGLPAQVKVRERAKVTVEELVGLLQVLGSATPLDISSCDLSKIDLSAEALDRLGCPKTLRSGGRGIDLENVRLEGTLLNRRRSTKRPTARCESHRCTAPRS